MAGFNSVGLDEQEASSIGMEVFPNPADRTANVIFTADRALSMEVYDVDGRLCMQRALNGAGAGLFRESIDVSGLPAGMYSVIVHGRNGQRGVTRMIVAGGETSGAVVGALGVSALEIGPEIDPGVPWTRALDGPPLALALKSGNFGAPDFFLKAWERLA